MDPVNPLSWVLNGGLRVPASPTPEERAMVLLLRHLTPEQQTTLLQHNYFDAMVRTKRRVWAVWFDGPEIVRFHNVRHGYVETKDFFWCVAALPVLDQGVPHWLPAADETLIKKMMVEANPEHFFRVANATPRERVAMGSVAELLASPLYSHALMLRSGQFFDDLSEGLR